MLVPRTREQSLGLVQREIVAEKASALGRVGERLEKFLDALQLLELQLVGTKGAERTPLISAHEAARKQAEQFLWYLVVQREALGIHSHTDLEQVYSIPPAIRA